MKSGLSLGFRFKEGGGEEMVIGEAVRRKEIKNNSKCRNDLRAMWGHMGVKLINGNMPIS